MTSGGDGIDDLYTVRDWLRHAVSRFNAAGLVYGHGTECAVDEAAFLILHTLSLPIDSLEPWLDARLTVPERRTIAAIIDRRITTRLPAPYLTGAAWIGPYSFRVDERVIVPRSFIGELLTSGGLAAVIADDDNIESVLDLCTGSGCLAILAALTYPAATVVAADVATDALAVAQDNVAAYGLEDRITVVQSDLYQSLEGRSFDLIIANPPYVTDAAVDAFPPEYAAEPRLAHAGGRDGLDLVRAIIATSAQHLNPGGWLVVEIGQGRESLESAYPDIDFFWLDTEASSGEVFALAADQLPGGGQNA
ncbi:MAG: 50S ribosomal protein L3 N(5)-glutamine methyltransferase [Hyphomicrobiaceae bacterium]|nr:50S ribosomal protein L3 N(5)-glutamine methyltransferase [Hyphomicrobiaceae bacterium]